MTLEQLNQHLDLRRQLLKSEELLASLRAAAEPGAQILTGMPHAPGYKNKLGNLVPEIADTADTVKRLTEQVCIQKSEIAAFIHTIPDFQTRMIFHLRFRRGMSWSAVASAVGGGNTESSVKNICYRYLEKL